GAFASREDGGEAKVFLHGGPTASSAKCLGTLVDYACLSADFGSPDSGLLALGGTDGRVRIMSLKPSAKTGGYAAMEAVVSAKGAD
ncbi:unnamed protein product, partial [Effrenium voratum]